MSFIQTLKQALAKKPRYLAVTEFWVYVPDPTPVDMSKIFGKLTRSGEVTPPEAMLASDIRLFLSYIRRSHNPHLFRPDTFAEHIEPTSEMLDGLAHADTIAKVRYLSEEPLHNDCHLGFIPRVAVEIARQKKGSVIFDSISEKLHEVDPFHQQLANAPDRYSSDQHLHTIWTRTENGGKAATRGLRKIGFPELETPETRFDHRHIVCEVLQKAAEELWDTREASEAIDVYYYDDAFVVRIKPSSRGPAQARIMRVSES